MSKLLKYLKKYKIESILAPFFKLIEVAFELTVPLIVSTIIDVGIENGDKVYIIKRCLLLGLLGILGLCSTLVAQYFSAKASVGFASDIRHALFKHIGKLSYSQLDSLGAPTLITRLTGDINQVQTGTNLTLRLVLRSPFVVFGAVIMAFTVDVKSSLVFVVAVPALAAVVFAIMLVCIPMYRKVQQKLDGLLSKTRENLLGTRVVRAFCKEEEEIADFDAKNNALTGMQTAVGRISAFMNPATFVLINLAIIALIYVGAIRVDSGAISRGAVVALYNYMSQILVELIKLANLIISVTKAIACGNRIQSVLDIEPGTIPGTVTDGNENSEYSVEFDKACLSYNGSEESLHNIDLKIPRGSSIGVIGSTGSGKTSLVNLIPRFYDVTGGCVLVDGVDVRDYDTKALRSKIGVVSQKKALFAGTVRDNIRFGKQDATDEEIWQALETAQAKQMIEDKSGQLDFVLEQEGKNLSGGQRQRMTIARALVRKPEVLILDDAASALDYATGAALNKALRNTDFAPTVITVSQRVAAIRNADTIVVLDEGEIVGIGTNDELLRSCEVYKEIFDSQLEKEDA
ncbi:MAG: ABC transporter ATP-binding protein [Oscillospiraceae bacterium]|nr:ABC transporter ATP-binding protein/permease [Oscillospiraceae bacterium]MDD6981903.1 ABC transporter ATP-binding protein [Oscillospiraceae bacterium]MDY4623320.1 ABC transporter ATP-binding protein [Oscillospiraceae bacterium]